VERSSAAAAAYQADVSSEEQVAAVFESMREQFGTVDFLVANAGLQRDAPFCEMTLEYCVAATSTVFRAF
jgi:glucose 1-dehydrogenase